MTTSEPFRETQRMRQPWIWILLGATGVVTVAAGSVVGLAITAAVVALFLAVRLTTEVREDGVYVRFAPFHRSFRRVPFADMERVETAEFGALTYGGVGTRRTPSTIVYMTDRGEGVEIHRPNARSVVIGSRRAEELASVIAERI